MQAVPVFVLISSGPMKRTLYSALLNRNKRALRGAAPAACSSRAHAGRRLGEENYEKGPVFISFVSKASEVTFPSTMRHIKKE